MIPVLIRKLYIDVIDERGTVWIFYFLEAAGLGFAQRMAGLEVYAHDGPPSLRRPLGLPAWPAEPKAGQPFNVRMDFADGPVEISGVPLLERWAPPAAPPPAAFEWHVAAPRLAVTLYSRQDPKGIPGIGYADFVTLHAAPRSLGLRRLRWGRFHGASATFVFTSVSPRRGPPWQHAALWTSSGAPATWPRFTLEEHATKAILHTSNAPLAADDVRVELGTERTLREGSAIDPARFPSARERLLYRVLMGATRESRWAGAATLHRAGGALPGTVLHESVSFG